MAFTTGIRIGPIQNATIDPMPPGREVSLQFFAGIDGHAAPQPTRRDTWIGPPSAL
jgi:hypothetical protein